MQGERPGGAVMTLDTIDVNCWMCGERFYVPARLHLIPPPEQGWYAEKVSANVWMWLEQRPILEHSAEHWPILVLWFFMWRAFTDISGIDVLEVYRRRS